MAESEQPLIGGKLTPKASSFEPLSFGMAFTLTFGFGLAMLWFGASHWATECDMQFQLFLVLIGSVAIILALFYLALRVQGPPKEEDDGAASGAGMCQTVLVVLFFAISCVGFVFSANTKDCDARAPLVMRYVFASVLAAVIIDSFILLSVVGRLGGPAFAVFGNLFGNFFEWIAGMFKGLSEALTEDGDESNPVPKRSEIEMFANVASHGAVLWFLAYILYETYLERNDECDRSLPLFLLAFCAYSAFFTYADFLYTCFAGVQTRKKLGSYFPFLWAFNAVLGLAWGIFGATQVFGSKTCKDTSKDVYRLSFLITLLFFIICAMVVLALFLVVGDYLCRGRVRVILVVEAGDENKGEEA